MKLIKKKLNNSRSRFLKKIKKEVKVERRILERQKVISDLIKLFMSPKSLNELLNEALSIATSSSLFSCDRARGIIFLADNQKNELNLVSFKGEYSETCKNLAFGNCICGTVAKNKHSMLVPNSCTKTSGRCDKSRPHGHFCLPILFDFDLLGVLNLYLAENQTCDEQEIKFIEDFTNVLADLIKRKKDEELIIATKEEAEIANRVKDEFIANMSHELRSPLNSITNTLRLLNELLVNRNTADYEDWEEAEQGIKYAQGAASRLLILINAILDLSKIGAGKMKFNMQLANLEEILEKACQEMFYQVQAKSLDLTLKRADFDTTIYLDSIKITQVIVNLLNNAIKFTPSGKKIEISIAQTFLSSGIENDGKIPALTFGVIDQGIGIPEDELELIFNEFSQSSLTKNGAGGTGLGLTIAKKIVLGHNGTISAENNLYGGATFLVALPKSI